MAMTVVNRCKRCRYVRYGGFRAKGRTSTVWLGMNPLRDEIRASILGNHVCFDCQKEINRERIKKPKPKPWVIVRRVKLAKPWVREARAGFVGMLG